jgi:subtilisin family serine protease
MRIPLYLIRASVVFCLFLGTVSGQTTQSVVREKLHPVFQELLAGKPAAADANLSKAGERVYEASITTVNADAVRSLGIHLNSVFGTIATARVTVDQLKRLVGLTDVAYVDPGSLNYPTLDVSVPEIGANLLHSGFLNNTQYKGKGVIVVIYDTGIDWRHLDFRDPVDTTKSRILWIWDQTVTPGSGESPPSGMTYGVEYSRQQIENELDGTPANFVKERDINGHGTHVAGIVAGNARATGKYQGIAPEADIIVVKGGDGSFSSGRMIDGLTFAANKASAAGKPVVVNWSIGGQSGPHDGTRDYEVAVDNFVQAPGKVVVISAGNDGEKVLHGSGTITAGGNSTVMLSVPTYTQTAGTSNDKFTLEIWFNTDLGVTATVTSPGGVIVSAGRDNSSSAANESDGSIDLFNLRGSNGNRQVQLTVQDRDTTKIPKTGDWTITLSGATTASAFNAWLSASSVGGKEVTVVNGNTQRTVSSPGTSEGAITVASYVTKNGWPSINGSAYGYSATTPMSAISAFSSQGPTGDGRLKPEIAAPGHGISSALSGWAESSTSILRILPDAKHTLTQGTSMAAPHVAGAAALLLQISKNLTASQIKSLLTSTAVVDANTGSVPNYTWGNGKLDLYKAAVKAVTPQASVQRQVLFSDAEGSSGLSTPLTGAGKFAYRFAPTFAGQLTGVYVNISSQANRSIAGTGSIVCEIWSNAAGNPGAKLGNSVLKPFQSLTVSTNNFIDVTSAGVTVNPGQEYHAVVYTSNLQDTLKIRTDATSPQVDRYSQMSGGVWSRVTGGNLRIRATVTSNAGLTMAEQDDLLPLQFDLAQNYPNPFNPATTIRYSVPAAGRVRVRVFDLVGREVALLVDEEQAPGHYTVRWNGTGDAGGLLATGVYFYKLESGGQSMTKKMLLMK